MNDLTKEERERLIDKTAEALADTVGYDHRIRDAITRRTGDRLAELTKVEKP